MDRSPVSGGYAAPASASQRASLPRRYLRDSWILQLDYLKTHFVIDSFEQLFAATQQDCAPIYARVAGVASMTAGSVLDSTLQFTATAARTGRRGRITERRTHGPGNDRLARMLSFENAATQCTVLPMHNIYPKNNP